MIPWWSALILVFPTALVVFLLTSALCGAAYDDGYLAGRLDMADEIEIELRGEINGWDHA